MCGCPICGDSGDRIDLVPSKIIGIGQRLVHATAMSWVHLRRL